MYERVDGRNDLGRVAGFEQIAKLDVSVLDHVVKNRDDLVRFRLEAEHDPQGMEDARLRLRRRLALPAMSKCGQAIASTTKAKPFVAYIEDMRTAAREKRRSGIGVARRAHAITGARAADAALPAAHRPLVLQCQGSPARFEKPNRPALAESHR